MASSRSLGSLTIDLIAKIGGWTSGLTKAERELDARTKRMNKMANDFGRTIGASLKSAATGFLAFAGVAVSFGAVTAGIKSAIDRADQLRDASIRLGVGVETLSAFGYAAQQTGTDIEELNKGLLRLSRNATTALDPKSRQAGLFQALGVSRDALTDLNKLVPQVADAFKQLEDGPTKAALALELMGRSGANLIEFFNQGGQGINDFTERARELGIVISDETAAAADEFNDKLADLKAAGTGLATQVAAELLPKLTELTAWAVDFVKDGNNARTIAESLSSAMSGLASAIDEIRAVGGPVIGFLEGLRGTLAGLEKQATAISFGITGQFQEAARRYKEGAAQINAALGTGPDFSNVTGSARGVFDNVVGGSSTVSARTNQSALEKFFATRSGGGSKAKKSGKSEAEKEAERLQAAYESMNERLREQAVLFGKTGEAAKVRYEIEMGSLKGLDQAKAQELIQAAEKLDLMNKEKEVQEELDRLTKEREDAINRGIESTSELISDMEFELELLGMTNREREKAIALRMADANATDEQRQKIAALSDELYRASETKQLVDDFKASLSDAFVDFASGAKSAKEAFGDFADYMYQRALQLLADKAIDALFKSFSNGTFGSSSGGFWDTFIGSFSSVGGKANGGWAMPNSLYEVNERGIEMARVGGRDYMLTGPQPVHITPNNRLGGGGGPLNLTQQFIVPGRLDSRSSDQLARKQGTEARRAMTRNGGG